MEKGIREIGDARSRGRDGLLACKAWVRSILKIGTLFERSLDPNKRAQLGAHYTSRDDILAIVEPVLMAPLWRSWAEVQAQAQSLVERRDASVGRQRTNRHNELSRLLASFAEEIAATRVLDPACGSGNFLYVSLKELLDLEKEVITFAGEVGLTGFFPKVGPEQVHGIEINEYAYDLAATTVWIGYIQWLRDNGFGRPAEPILKPLETVTQILLRSSWVCLALLALFLRLHPPRSGHWEVGWKFGVFVSICVP